MLVIITLTFAVKKFCEADKKKKTVVIISACVKICDERVSEKPLNLEILRVGGFFLLDWFTGSR